MWRLQTAHFGGKSPAMCYRVHSTHIQQRHTPCDDVMHVQGMIEVSSWLPAGPHVGMHLQEYTCAIYIGECVFIVLCDVLYNTCVVCINI